MLWIQLSWMGSVDTWFSEHKWLLQAGRTAAELPQAWAGDKQRLTA